MKNLLDVLQNLDISNKYILKYWKAQCLFMKNELQSSIGRLGSRSSLKLHYDSSFSWENKSRLRFRICIKSERIRLVWSHFLFFLQSILSQNRLCLYKIIKPFHFLQGKKLSCLLSFFWLHFGLRNTSGIYLFCVPFYIPTPFLSEHLGVFTIPICQLSNLMNLLQ